MTLEISVPFSEVREEKLSKEYAEESVIDLLPYRNDLFISAFQLHLLDSVTQCKDSNQKL